MIKKKQQHMRNKWRQFWRHTFCDFRAKNWIKIKCNLNVKYEIIKGNCYNLFKLVKKCKSWETVCFSRSADKRQNVNVFCFGKHNLFLNVNEQDSWDFFINFL